MKTITEEQAQKLADLLGCYIAVDMNGDVYWYVDEPEIGSSAWLCEYDFNFGFMDGICIESDRPWSELLFKPNKL